MMITYEGFVRIWDLKSGSYKEHALSNVVAGQIPIRIISCEGKLIISYYPNIIKIWDLETGAFEKELHFNSATLFGHTKEGKLLIGSQSSMRDSITVFDLKSGEYHESKIPYYIQKGRKDMPATKDYLKHFFVRNERELIIVCGFYDENGGKILIWDLETNRIQKELQGLSKMRFRDCCLTEDGSQLFTVYKDSNEIRIYNLTTEESTIAFEKSFRDADDSSAITALCLSKEELISGDADGKIKIWDLGTGACKDTFPVDESPISSLTLTEDHKLLAKSKTNLKVLDLYTSKTGLFESLARAFEEVSTDHDHTQTMQRFLKLSQADRNRIYFELYNILKPSSSDKHYGEHAFHDQCGLRSTPQQKAQAIRNHSLRSLAHLFESDTQDCKLVMDRFLKLPQSERNKIYYELYKILKPSSSHKHYGEHAFLDQRGLRSTPQQKAQAIRNYLNGKSS